MRHEATRDDTKRNFDNALDRLRDDLDRVELLALALNIFSQPIPEYEPRFHHIRRTALTEHEMPCADARDERL